VVEGEQEVRVLLQHVLPDDRLPDGPGTRIAEVARERDMDAVVSTGDALQSVKQDRERYDYLLKPVRPAELIEAIERHLGRDGRRSPNSIA
jgi:DNA-binding response OmpR family regulator